MARGDEGGVGAVEDGWPGGGIGRHGGEPGGGLGVRHGRALTGRTGENGAMLICPSSGLHRPMEGGRS